MKKILFTILILFSLITFGQKALVVNGEITRTGLPTKFERLNGQTVWGGYDNLHDSIHYNDGWRDVVIPIYDDKTQKLGARYYNTVADIVTYPVINKTVDELKAEKEMILQVADESHIDNLVIKRLLQNLTITILTKTAVSQQDIDDISVLYPQYRAGTTYVKLQRFNYEGKFYEVTTNFTGTEILDTKNVVDMYVKYVK